MLTKIALTLTDDYLSEEEIQLNSLVLMILTEHKYWAWSCMSISKCLGYDYKHLFQ